MYLTFLSIQEGHSKKFRGNLKKCGDYVKQFKTQNSKSNHHTWYRYIMLCRVSIMITYSLSKFIGM